MKAINVLIILIISVIFTFAVNGQKVPNLAKKSGVYRTFEDFKAKRLNPEVDNTKETYKIKISDYLTRPYIDIIHSGKKYSFLKKNIYGIREGEGRDFRFFNNKEYLILDTGKIYIYSVVAMPEPDKSSKSITSYFYSVKGNSKITALTLTNLKNTYPENPKFHDLMDVYFKNDADLTAYDDYYKTYKVNRFLFKHLK